jgi:hypothetical protein
MKTVYSKSQDVIHLFANLTDDERFTRSARCSNVFFKNGVLYSYGTHFVLARYVQTKKGLIVLVNTDSYSVTTSKHKSQVQGALSHLNTIYVPGAESSPDYVFDAFTREARPHLEKLVNARKPELYISELNRLLFSAAKYAQVMGVKVRRDLQSLLTVKDAAKYAEAIKKQQATELKKQKTNFAKGLKQWRDFEPVTVSARCPDRFSYLRYNAEAKRIETSQHVELPLTYAKQFWQMIEYGRRTGDFETLIGFRVLDRFAVRSFNSKTIEIGCHKLALSEIDAIAKQMQWKMPAKPVLSYTPSLAPEISWP